MTKQLLTPLGALVNENELDDLGRIECPQCHLAVIEDEYFPCPECGQDLCLYCWEAGCPNCENKA